MQFYGLSVCYLKHVKLIIIIKNKSSVIRLQCGARELDERSLHKSYKQ